MLVAGAGQRTLIEPPASLGAVTNDRTFWLESSFRTKIKHPPFGECLILVARVHTDWNLILSGLDRWNQLSRGNTVLSYSTAAD
jgi:hypothetical protein